MASAQLVSSDDNLHLTHATPLQVQPAICRLVHLQLTSSPAIFHAILCSVTQCIYNFVLVSSYVEMQCLTGAPDLTWTIC